MPYKNKILDAGQLKSIDHYMSGISYKKEMQFLEDRYRGEYTILETKCREPPVEYANECYQKLKGMTKPWDMTNKMLMEYYDFIPYRPCWMLNISPDWKGNKLKRNVDTAKKVAMVRRVMNIFYGDASRFTKMKYTIEGGKEGNFLHIHAVFELNIKKPNNINHMKKGNFLKSFRTIWNTENKDTKWEGLVGSKYALQTTFLTTKEMLNDKLDYLIEDKKPASHQNHPDFASIVVGEWD